MLSLVTLLVLSAVAVGALTVVDAAGATEPATQAGHLTSHAIEITGAVRLRAGEHQSVPINAVASGRAVVHAHWSAQGLPPGMRLLAEPGHGWVITGIPRRVGKWQTQLQARFSERDAWATARGVVTVSVTTARGAYLPTVDWVPPGMQIGEYGNEGLGDCSVAAMATDLQVVEDAIQPLPAGPWISEYDSLATAAGEDPGPDAGVEPQSVFAAMSQPGNSTGIEISSIEQIPISPRSLRAWLHATPIYVVLSLPPATGSLARRLDPSTGIVTTVWSSATSAPYVSAAAAIHAALLVGYDESQDYFFIATWGHVFAMPGAYLQSLITNAWVIDP